MKRLIALLSFCLIVSPPVASAQSADPLLRMELEKDAAVPGQPILLRIRILVPTWLPKPPAFPSFEIPNVIVRAVKTRSGSASERVGAETWSGVSRSFRLYPMTTGDFRIPPRPVTVIFADPKTRKPMTVTILSDAITFSGMAPAGAENLDPFLAARKLEIDQTIEGEPSNMEPGQAFTRTVTARITGTSPIFLPPLISSTSAPGFSVYPKEPIVTEREKDGVLSGERIESVTYVAEAGGRFSVPAIRLQWFRIGKRQIETSEAAGFEIVSRGPVPATNKEFGWPAFFRWLVAGLLIAVFAGFIGWRVRPRVRAWNQGRREAYRASEAFAFSQATEALNEAKLGSALRAIDLWSSRLPPVGGQKDHALSEALVSLGTAAYGQRGERPSSSQWRETVHALQRARQARNLARRTALGGSSLPKLNPHSVVRTG